MNFFFKYLNRITKGFIFIYLFFFIVFSLISNSFIPFISFILILCVLLYHFFLKGFLRKEQGGEITLKDKLILFGSILIIGFISISFNTIFGIFFLVLFFIESYFIFNDIRLNYVKKINYVERFFNLFLMSLISFNLSYLFLNLIYYFLSDFRLSIFEMILFYGFPFIIISFFIRQFFIHLFHTYKKRSFSFSDVLTIFSSSFKKSFILLLIVLLVYLIVSSVIYFVFVNRYNSIIDDSLINDEIEYQEAYQTIRSDYIFNIPIYYGDQETEDLECKSELDFKIRNVFDDSYLYDIFCAYGRISYLLVTDDEEIQIKIDHSDGLITEERDIYVRTLDNLRSNSKIYYLINSYLNFFESFEVVLDEI